MSAAEGRDEPRPGAPQPLRDLGLVRANLVALYLLGATLLLGAAHLAGALPRAPVVVAVLGFLLSLAGTLVRSCLGLASRFLWRIRRKLILSYVFLTLTPLLLVTVLGALLAYVLTGQFFAYLAYRQIAELERELDETTLALVGRVVELADTAGDLAGLARAVEERADLLEPLRSLRARYPDVSASLVVFRAGRAEAYVPPGLEWPAGTRAERPAWLTGSGFEAGFAIDRSNNLEIRSALSRKIGDLEVYAETAVPLDETTLETLKRRIGTDLEVVAHGAQGGDLTVLAATRGIELPGRGWLRAAPVLGLFYVNPLRWEDGEVLHEGRLLVAKRSLASLYGDLFDFRAENRILIVSLLLAALILSVFIQAASLVVGVSLARSITGSIDEIFLGTQRIERGEFGRPVEVRSRDQLGSLTGSFNQMAAAVERLLRESADRERLEEELRIGRRIQQSLLPRRAWGSERLELGAVSLPAREVGGDYYDYFELDEERLGLLVADVSGKGTEAAFYMAELKGIMLALTRLHPRPAEVLVHANELLSKSLDRRTFVSMCYGVLRLDKPEFAFARAGHCPALYLAASSHEVVTLKSAGLALGIDRRGGFRSALEERSQRLDPGDLLLLYTDGVTDAVGGDGSFFGEERLARAFREARGGTAEAIRDALVGELRRFAAEGPLHDDLTLVVVRARS